MADIDSTLPPDDEDENQQPQKPQPGSSNMSPDDIQNLASKIQSPAGRQILEQMGKVANDPQYAANVPANNSATLQKAIQDAKSAYDQKVSQNEWLDVAQTLGRAVAQFGGAMAGRAGGNRANMSELNMGQPIDYNARSDRAFKEYAQAIGNAKDFDTVTRQAAQDEQQRRQYELGRQEGFLKPALSASLQEERDRTMEANANARANRADNALDRRLSQQQQMLDDRRADELRRNELKDVTQQENDLKSKLQAARALGINAASDSALSKKSQDDLARQYGPLAAKAGVDPSTLTSIGEQSKDEGVMGSGLFKSEDKAKKQQLIEQQIVAPIKNMLDGIQARKKQLIQGAGQTAASRQQSSNPPPASDTTSPPPAGQDPQIQKYADQYKLSYDDAKKVLVGRGYKPAE